MVERTESEYVFPWAVCKRVFVCVCVCVCACVSTRVFVFWALTPFCHHRRRRPPEQVILLVQVTCVALKSDPLEKPSPLFLGPGVGVRQKEKS